MVALFQIVPDLPCPQPPLSYTEGQSKCQYPGVVSPVLSWSGEYKRLQQKSKKQTLYIYGFSDIEILFCVITNSILRYQKVWMNLRYYKMDFVNKMDFVILNNRFCYTTKSITWYYKSLWFFDIKNLISWYNKYIFIMWYQEIDFVIKKKIDFCDITK